MARTQTKPPVRRVRAANAADVKQAAAQAQATKLKTPVADDDPGVHKVAKADPAAIAAAAAQAGAGVQPTAVAKALGTKTPQDMLNEAAARAPMFAAPVEPGVATDPTVVEPVITTSPLQAVAPNDIATDEELVAVNVPRAFNLTLDNGQIVAYKAGGHRVPASHLEHWYAHANGMTRA